MSGIDPVIHPAGRKKPLMVLRLTDGLGNQLFQYAFARSMAIQYGYNVWLDRSWYWMASREALTKQPRNSELLRMPCCLSDMNITLPITGMPFCYLARILLPRRFYTREDETRFYLHDPAIIERLSHPTTFLTTIWGFWQSTRYFDDIRPVLCRELFPKKVVANTDLAAARPRPCVAIHIRKGFVPGLWAGVCSLSYYRNAIRLMRSRLTDPLFAIFTDDIPWVKAEFCTELKDVLGDARLMDNRSDMQNFVEMLVQCQHYIICNSTYSWWPAYLSQASQKMVIAPKHWLSDPSLEVQLYPEDWIRMET
jgi:hypothetical protein